MTSNKPMDVVIVGGSLSGLFTGIVLKRLGHNITILERSSSSSFKDQGAGIATTMYLPQLSTSLKILGVTSGNPIMDFFEKYDRTRTKFYQDRDGLSMQVLKRDGGIKFEKHLPVLTATSSWEILYHVARANFDGVLKGSFVDANAALNVVEIGNELVEVEYVGADGKTGSLKCNLLIGADGASSIVRRIVYPEVERTYSGYVSWRGTCTADRLSASTIEMFRKGLIQYYCKGHQVVHYTIPGPGCQLEPGKELFNIVWYNNYKPSSTSLKDLLTDDNNGTTHLYTNLSMQPELIKKQKELVDNILPPQISEIWRNIEKPFVTTTTDNYSDKAVFTDGKVILIGDALAGLRPHTGAGTSQAALHALLLEKVFRPETEERMEIRVFEKSVCGWARETMELGVKMGDLSQFGSHPMAEE